eukprot:jgi/Botrbrau1/15797/Bobra.4_1s0148.1
MGKNSRGDAQLPNAEVPAPDGKAKKKRNKSTSEAQLTEDPKKVVKVGKPNTLAVRQTAAPAADGSGKTSIAPDAAEQKKEVKKEKKMKKKKTQSNMSAITSLGASGVEDGTINAKPDKAAKRNKGSDAVPQAAQQEENDDKLSKKKKKEKKSKAGNAEQQKSDASRQPLPLALPEPTQLTSPAEECQARKERRKKRKPEEVGAAAAPSEHLDVKVSKKKRKAEGSGTGAAAILPGIPGDTQEERQEEGKKKKEKGAEGGPAAGNGGAAAAAEEVKVLSSLAENKTKKAKKEKGNGGEALAGVPKQAATAVVLSQEAPEVKGKNKDKKKKEGLAGETGCAPGLADGAEVPPPVTGLRQSEREKTEKSKKKGRKGEDKKGVSGGAEIKDKKVDGVTPEMEACGAARGKDGKEEKVKKKKRKAEDIDGGEEQREGQPTVGGGERKEKEKKHNKKKQKVEEAGAVVHSQVASEDGDKGDERSGEALAGPGAVATPTPASGSEGPKRGKGSSSHGQLFRRVVAEEWLDKKGAWDNSYTATFGESGWGAKAEAVLGSVRGKNFRHEKTKKKRGSYRGGAISPDAVHSFKFDSDNE